MPKEFQVYRYPQALPLNAPGSVVAIGNFDGVHKGHQAVLAAAREKAGAQGLWLIVLTFDPHPREVLTPQKAPLRLTPFDEKCGLLAQYGADGVYVIEFSLAYAKTSAEAFVEETLVKALRANHVVVGADFAFGRNREGDVAMLEKAGKAAGFKVHVQPLLKDTLNDEAEQFVTSTAIRKHIAQGEHEKARALLGHDIRLLK